MKTLQTSLLLSLLLLLGCKSTTKDFNPEDYYQVTLYEVILEDKDQPGNSAFVILKNQDDHPVILKKDSTLIYWCFTNMSKVGKVSGITIDSFVDMDNPDNKNPFGKNLVKDNSFYLDTIEFRYQKCIGEILATKEGHYKYKISAVIEKTDNTKQNLDIEKEIFINP